MTSTSSHLLHPPAVDGLALRPWLWGVLGPALFGAALGIPHSFETAAHLAVKAPFVVAATALLTAPSLFVVLALFDAGPSLRRYALACASALESVGLTLAGLAPALMFIAATEGGHFFSNLTGLLFMAVAGVVSLRGFYRLVVESTSGMQVSNGASREVQEPLGVFILWSLVALSIGGYLVIKHLVLAGGL